MYHLLVNCSRWSWFLPAQFHFDVVYKFPAILLLYLRPAQGPLSTLSLSSFVKFATDAIIKIFRSSILMLQILKSLWCCCIWYTCDLRKDTSFRLATLSFFFCYICRAGPRVQCVEVWSFSVANVAGLSWCFQKGSRYMRLRTQKHPQVKGTLQGAKCGCKEQSILSVDILFICLIS